MLGMAACDKNEEIPANGAPDNAEKLAAGTYVGEWSRTNLSNGEVESGSGSIVFSLNDEQSNNVCVMTLDSSTLELGVNSNVSACNITRLNSGELVYYNMLKTNPFGMDFTGRISPEGVVSMKYTKIVKSGRKEIEYNYTFSGTKQ